MRGNAKRAGEGQGHIHKVVRRLHSGSENIVIHKEVENPVKDEVGTAAYSVQEKLLGQVPPERPVEKMNGIGNKFSKFLHKQQKQYTFARSLRRQKYIISDKRQKKWTTITKKMQHVRAKKSLGQHFLRDMSVAGRTADTVTGGSVLEIGPGTGVLTQFLLNNPDISLTAVELDHESVVYLQNTLLVSHSFRLIEGDVLKMDWGEMFDGDFSVIGNYPYNISSQIFFKVLEYKDRISVCSGMLQKEVAERLASVPGKKAYGILSVLLQVWYDIEYLFTVDAQMFNPPPKVQSAVIRLTRNKRRSLGCDESLFKTVVKTSFNQRRKQMRNSLQQLAGKGNPVLEEDIFSKRPEQLSVEEFVELTKLLQPCQN